jgi:hypothetical protein
MLLLDVFPVSPMNRMIVTVLCLQIVACMPAQFSGYTPSGTGALEGGYCRAGAKDIRRIKMPSGVELTIWGGDKGRDGTVELQITLFVPADTTVQLLSPNFLAESMDWRMPRTLTVEQITGPGSPYSPTSVLQGATRTERSGPQHARFALWFQKGVLAATSLPVAKSFRLKFPELLINASRYQVEDVVFTSYKTLGAYTCLQ